MGLLFHSEGGVVTLSLGVLRSRPVISKTAVGGQSFHVGDHTGQNLAYGPDAGSLYPQRQG